jgi:CHAT domain-containing protein
MLCGLPGERSSPPFKLRPPAPRAYEYSLASVIIFIMRVRVAVPLVVTLCLSAQRAGDPKYAALASQVVLAPDDAARETLLNGHRELVNHDLVVAINQLGSAYYDKRDVAGGMRVIDIVCAVAGRIPDAAGLATCAYSRGIFLAADRHSAEAIAKFREALARYQRLNDHASQARALNQIAIIHSIRAEYAEAQPLYEQAMQQAGLSGDRERVAQTSLNLGNILKAQGNYRDATKAIQRSLDICRELKLERDSARPMLSMAGLYNYQRDFEMALKYARDSLEVQEQFGFMEIRAGTYGNLALAYQGLGRMDRARRYFDMELKLAAETNDFDSRMMALYNSGDLIREQHQPAAAGKNFRESLELALQIGRRSMATHNRISLAEVANDTSRWNDALAFCDAASGDARSLGELLLVMRLGDTCGLSQLRLGRLPEAEALFREAIDATETTRRQLAGEQETAAIFMHDKEGLYHHMVEALLAQGRTEEALRYAEMAKGRVVLDILMGGRTSLNKSMTAEEQQRESALRLRMAALGEELVRRSSAAAPDVAALAVVKDRLDQTRLEHRSLLNSLYATHPQLRLQRVDFDPAAPAEFTEAMADPDAAMLEYVVADRNLYLFVVTRESGRPHTAVYTLPLNEQRLSRDVARFREQIGSRDLDYAAAARALYRALIEPAREQLRGKTTLVIVPDRFLWQLPFQALQSAEGRHLIQDHAVFYSPSLTVLREIVRGRGGPAGPPHVLAVAAARLAESEHEVTALRELYGAASTKVYLAAEADEQLVRREAPKYSLLHLAAHGVFEAASPMASHITLAKNGKPEAGLLEAREMMTLDLHAGLVVLSGCETGRGGIGNGEGLIGMSWALFVAGAPATVASQWKVDSKSTSQMMLAFHANLRKSPAKARALQQAALAMMRRPEYRHPFYWSAFALLGQGF